MSHPHPLDTSQGSNSAAAEESQLREQIAHLGEWFHNLDLKGVKTAPNHFLGDFPSVKWNRISPVLPQNLQGATVLDVGCNAGFYSIELKKRGAKRVLGIDVCQRYLDQAGFAAQTLDLDIEFENLSVYAVDEIPGQFDYVLFMGLFYHLRYPLLALDKVIKKVKGELIFQTMIRGSVAARQWEADYAFTNREVFQDPDFPAMYFIEQSYARDQTNWWIPNRAAVEGMLRSSGLQMVNHPEEETWICVPRSVTRNGRYVLDMELNGSL